MVTILKTITFFIFIVAIILFDAFVSFKFLIINDAIHIWSTLIVLVLYIFSTLFFVHKVEKLETLVISLAESYLTPLFIIMTLLYPIIVRWIISIVQYFYYSHNDFFSFFLQSEIPLIYIIFSGFFGFFIQKINSLFSETRIKKNRALEHYVPYMHDLKIKILKKDMIFNYKDTDSMNDQFIKYKYINFLSLKPLSSTQAYHVVPLDISFTLHSSNEKNHFYNIQPCSYIKHDTIRFVNKPFQSHSHFSYQILCFIPNNFNNKHLNVRLPIYITSQQFYHYKIDMVFRIQQKENQYIITEFSESLAQRKHNTIPMYFTDYKMLLNFKPFIWKKKDWKNYHQIK